MTIVGGTRWRDLACGSLVALAVCFASAGCNNPGATPTVQNTTTTTMASGGVSTGSGGLAAQPLAQPLAAFDSFTPGGVALPGSAGSGGRGGTSLSPSGPPFGTSTTCGDRIVGPDAMGKLEECDDGDEGSDACTALCQTRDQSAYASGSEIDRYQGAGRHPVAGLDVGVISTYVEFPPDEGVAGGEPFSGEGATVGATVFNIWGQPAWHFRVSDGASPIDDANPVAAALPNAAFAVAWSDFDGDGSDLGVALRRVNADGGVGPLGVANAQAEFSQLNPDMLWTGSQLVVAWEDYSDGFNGPDLRYRLFDAELNPLSGDLPLAGSALPEAGVALASFNDGWAAAYREGAADGKEYVVVRVGDKAFRVGPVQGGPMDDRPSLVAPNATHLLLVFSAGTDPTLPGVYNVPRIWYSVIDTASASAPAFQPLDPLDDVFTTDVQVSHLSPVVERGADGFYVAWRSEARPGDAAGDQLWLKYLSWDPARTPMLEAREAEMLIPRTCEGSQGDQRRPALAYVGLPPSGALAIAWDDYSHSQGASAGDPDVVVHYAPLHKRELAEGSVFTESWRGITGAPWSSQWSTELTSGAATVDVQNNQGRFMARSASSGVSYVNHHTALNVELLARIRFNLNGANAGLIARRADGDADSYFGVRYGTSAGESFRLFALIDGVRTDLQTQALPYAFNTYAQGLDYQVRFRVVTNPDQTVTLSAKYWLADLPEPSSWTLSGSFAANSAAAVRLGNRAGRFGVLVVEGQSGRSTTLDDFRAIFYEGSLLGDPSNAIAPALPLKRASASYRICDGTNLCTTGEACCNDASECAAGLACTGGLSEFLGVGSHAKTCAPAHCVNQRLDADEARADCGGADCVPCSCTSTVARGAAGYATAACPGGVGDADCNTDADCVAGLKCVQERGFQYGWAEGSDVCRPPHCQNRAQDVAQGELGPDWGGECGDVQCVLPRVNGGYQNCTVSCPCGTGQGDCDFTDECLPGMLCSTKGPTFGVAFNVCVAAHCTNNIKDADETSKDCGGADCGTICP